ncbi:MAG: hypothetical protein ACI8PZ_001960 [Myxococcota bacterium]|jgi:hypothetical protein
MSTLPDVAETTTTAPSTWATDRLRLGQTNVGFWVVIAASLVVVGDLPAAVDSGVGAWAAIAAAQVAIQLPFDVVGGYSLPLRHGRWLGGLDAWAAEWARGAVVSWGLVTGVGASTLAVGGAGGSAAAVAWLAAVGVGMVAAQGLLVQLVAGRRAAPLGAATASVFRGIGLDPDRVRVLDVADRGFVGGWVGAPGAERLILPRRWLGGGDAELTVLGLRRQLAVATGARAWGVLGALVFNVVGLVGAAWLTGADLSRVDGLLVFSAAFTLWSFLGLLTLPTVSRRGVVALDRAVVERAGSRPLVERVFTRLDHDQEDEPVRAGWIETIFHPVPSVASRSAALRASTGPGPGAPWRVARTALFVGWGQLSWLSRAVHCNCGRPVLWALPPGD